MGRHGEQLFSSLPMLCALARIHMWRRRKKNNFVRDPQWTEGTRLARGPPFLYRQERRDVTEEVCVPANHPAYLTYPDNKYLNEPD